MLFIRVLSQSAEAEPDDDDDDDADADEEMSINCTQSPCTHACVMWPEWHEQEHEAMTLIITIILAIRTCDG